MKKSFFKQALDILSGSFKSRVRSFAAATLCRSVGTFRGIHFSKFFQKQGLMSLNHALGFLLFFAVSVPLSGQSLGRQLIGSAGGSGRFGDLQISWSLGEVAVGHLKATNGTGRLTEGFQQPRLMPLNEGVDPTLVQVAPNPVKDVLSLYIPGDATEEWIMTLGDVNGRTMLRRTGLTTGNSEVDLGQLPSGVYFLTIAREANGEVRQTIKVVKL
jgi:hypothetical protein